VRYRRQIRTVGLDQHAIERHLGGDIAQRLRIFVRQHAREGNVQSHSHARLRRRQIAGERVHHRADRAVLVEIGTQHPHRVGLGFPAMDNDGAIELAGQVEMPCEVILLLRERRSIPIPIEARFAQRDNFRAL